MNEELNSINLLFMMMDERLKPIARPHLDLIKEKFNNQKLIDQLALFISSKNEITPRDVEKLLDENQINGDARNNLINSYLKVKDLSDSGIELIKNDFRKMVATIIFGKISKIKNPDEALSRLFAYRDKYEFKADGRTTSEKITHYELGSLDPDKVLEEFGTPITSSIKDINECFNSGGYIKHQLVCIVAPPSTGKSLFLMNEAVHMIMSGHRVCYIALGDLTQYDFMTRCSSIGLGLPMSMVAKDLKKYWNGFKEILAEKLDNFGVFYIDANEVTSGELSKYIKDNELDKKYNIFIVDYDTNFKSKNDMYLKGDEIYNDLANLAKKVDLVFIASQPKIGAFGAELIQMGDAAESGRKPQIVDVMITISKNQKSVGTQIGKINIAKIRRNGKSTNFPYMLNPSGKFIPIAMTHYKAIEKDGGQKYAPSQGLISDETISEITGLLENNNE